MPSIISSVEFYNSAYFKQDCLTLNSVRSSSVGKLLELLIGSSIPPAPAPQKQQEGEFVFSSFIRLTWASLAGHSSKKTSLIPHRGWICRARDAKTDASDLGKKKYVCIHPPPHTHTEFYKVTFHTRWWKMNNPSASLLRRRSPHERLSGPDLGWLPKQLSRHRFHIQCALPG